MRIPRIYFASPRSLILNRSLRPFLIGRISLKEGPARIRLLTYKAIIISFLEFIKTLGSTGRAYRPRELRNETIVLF